MGLFDRFKKVDPKPEQAHEPAKEDVKSHVQAPAKEATKGTAQDASQYVLNTPKISELYQKIADTVTDMIPDEWTNLYFYGEVLNDSTTAFFYYKQAKTDALLYCHYIPEVYKVSKDAYSKMLRCLYDTLRELRDEYKNNFKAVWTNFTLTMDNDGNFNMKYNYDDVLNTDLLISDRHAFWEYEVLGRIPVEDKVREKLKSFYGDRVNFPEKNKLIGQKLTMPKCPVCGAAELNKRDIMLYRCEKCMTRFYTNAHDVILYSYDAEMHTALYNAFQFANQGDYTNALKALIPYENKAWDNLGYTYQLGLAMRRAGYNSQACNVLFKCKYIKLDYVMAYHSIGLVKFANREFRSALKEYEYSLKFLEADPDSYSIDERRTFYAYYGGSLAGCGRKEEGEEYIKKAEAMGYTNGAVVRQIAGLT